MRNQTLPKGSKQNPIVITDGVDNLDITYGKYVVVTGDGCLTNSTLGGKRVIVTNTAIMQNCVLTAGHLIIENGAYAENIVCHDKTMITIRAGGTLIGLGRVGKVNIHLYPGAYLETQDEYLTS